MAQNPTEALFDRYLDLREYPFERIPESMTPTADRRVVADGITVIVEVEGFAFSEKDRQFAEDLQRTGHRVTLGLLGRNRYLRALDNARPQLDRPEYAGLPRLVVIGRHPFVDAGSVPIQVAMYAKSTPLDPVSAVAVIQEICPDEEPFGALVHEAMERERSGVPDKRALMVRYLELWDELKIAHPEFDLEKREPCLELCENPIAAVALPRSVFWGPHDRRWADLGGGDFRELNRTQTR